MTGDTLEAPLPEPLSGYRVVDMTTAVQGPAAGLYLSDMGAEVVKVERPTGEATRFLRGPNNPHPQEAHGTQFVAVNRGKKMLRVDAEGELGRSALYRLIERSDVFLTNYRELAMERLGFGYEALRALNPQLVYAAVNGFGPLGPLADKAMVDGAAQARGGLPHLTGDPDGPPRPAGGIIADTAGGMQLALGILTALLARERHGVGQKVNTSGYGTQLWLQMWEIAHAGATGQSLRRAGAHHGGVPGMYGIYETADHDHLFMAFPLTTPAWVALCEFAGEHALGADEQWHDVARRIGMNDPDADYDAVRERLRLAFLRKPMKDWEAFLDSEPEIIWNRVFNHNDVLNDPQALANDYVVEMDISGIGPSRVVGNVVQLSETPGSAKGPSPEPGQHTEEVLLDLGYSWDEISAINDETEASVARAIAASGRPL